MELVLLGTTETRGMGAGSVVGMLEANNIQTNVVEINPDVIDAASQFFQIHPSGTVYSEDAVIWLESPLTNESIYYDVIVHDVFTTGSAYTQLYNVHMFTRLKQHLRLPTEMGDSGDNVGAGIVLVNFVGYHQGPHRFAALSIYRSLLHVFDYVRCFRDEQVDVDPLEQGNLVFVASSQPIHFLNSEHDKKDRDVTSQAYIEPNTPDWIRANFHHWEVNFDQELRMLRTEKTISEEWKAPALLSLTDYEVFRSHSGPIHDDIFRAIRHLLPPSKWTL
jgi:spermidine synthase